MTQACLHDFRIHVGQPVFGRRAMAWIDHQFVSSICERPQMWRCSKCGEQGYEVIAVPTQEEE